ncbi:HAD-IA family hydrolase [Notoacmeibacter sp. MSK16QG-6]|uniref:HAD-IA family hydrolase n=1 Tax=Notoacmeibacter sp. MSK16QG-6 TaxID=2957982 RepID=UPI00209FB01B|nr:HAD-IA family hydrolase [Notoacmeibacter sp. MSK16QG-6]MCP1200709.1 HAD-IA family hydrolase [Notoacmeibacter sp. MSK16QG-6]
MKLVLFDCDGTLVDGAGLICATMDATFAEHGLPLPPTKATRNVIGRSLDLAIAELLPANAASDVPHLVQRYKEHYHRMRLAGQYADPIYDGIAELIATLEMRDDVLLGIVTGKSRRGVASVFAAHGFGDHFVTVRTADDCPSKPHPAMVWECCSETGMEPADTLVIGDTVYDMEMAVSADARAIGVDWGYGSVDALRRAGAEVVLSRPDQLLTCLPEAV